VDANLARRKVCSAIERLGALLVEIPSMDIQQVVENGPKIARRFAVLSIVQASGPTQIQDEI
jgi:hypothetical protein